MVRIQIKECSRIAMACNQGTSHLVSLLCARDEGKWKAILHEAEPSSQRPPSQRPPLSLQLCAGAQSSALHLHEQWPAAL